MSHALLTEVALLVTLAACAPAACAPPAGSAPTAPIVDVAPEAGSADDRDLGTSEVPWVDKAPPEIAWRDQVEPAIERALAAGRVALVYIRADWSVPSIEVERELWPDPTVRRAARGVEAVVVDVSDPLEPASEQRRARFAVRRLPTILVLDGRGIERSRFEGKPEAAALVAALHAAQR